MAGILKPTTAIVEGSYKIWGYNLYDPAENLFNGSETAIFPGPYAGTYIRQSSPITYWHLGSYLDIEFYQDVDIYDYGSAGNGWNNPLPVYDNTGGVKGGYVKDLSANTMTATWTYIGFIPKGRYLIETNGGNYRISTEWYLEAKDSKRILILADGKYQKWDGSWQTITSATPTEQEYLQGNTPSELASIPESAWRELLGEVKLSCYTDGAWVDSVTIETTVEPYTIYDEFGDFMEVLYYTDDLAKTSANLEVIANYSPLDELDDEFEVVTWTNDETIVPNLNLTFLALPQVVEMKANIDIEIKELNSVTMVAGLGGTGTLKTAVSGDNGLTYRIWNTATSMWDVIDIHTQFKQKGMLVDKVNTLTKADWAKLFTSGEPKVRFAYYLENNSITDVVEVSSVTMSVVTPGRWKSAIPGTDYSYEYASGEKIYFTILTDGTYKVNYPSANEIPGTPTAPVDGYDDTEIKEQLTDLQVNIMKLGLKTIATANASKYQMNNLLIDDFNDTSGIDLANTTAIYHDGKFALSSPFVQYDMSKGLANGTTSYTTDDGDVVTLIPSLTSYLDGSAAHIFDGDNTNFGYMLDGEGTITMLIEFARSMELSKLDIYGREMYDMRAVVEGSNDSTNGTDGTWIPLGDVTYNETGKSVPITEPSIKYLRLNVSNVSSAWTRIHSIDIFGAPVDETGPVVLQSIPETLIISPKSLLLSSIQEVTNGTIIYEATRDGVTWKEVTADAQVNGLIDLPEGTELIIRATLTGDAILHAWSYSWN